VEKYHVARSFNRSFLSGARLLNSNPTIDPDRFCRIQVTWAIDRRRSIFPTLLAGGALSRYKEYPTAGQEVKHSRACLLYEIRDFAAMAQVHGFEGAIAQRSAEHTPLFLGLMYLDYKQSIPDALLEDARSQLRSEPSYRQVLPKEYLTVLEG
jgi:hypothetical protein